MSVIDDTLLGLDSRLAVKWSATVQAFVENDADAPPVTAAVIVGTQDDLRCHVLTGADDTAGHLSSIMAIAPTQQAFAVCMLFGLSSGEESTANVVSFELRSCLAASY